MNRHLRIVFIFLLSACMVLMSCTGDISGLDDLETKKEYKILFLGTSLITAFVDIPGIFKALAEADRYPVYIDAVRDNSISFHLRSEISMNKLAEEDWDFVIVTENSFIASSRENRAEQMYPYVRTLDSLVSESGAQLVLYLQCAYSDETATQYGLGTYLSMQSSIIDGYFEIGNELDLPIVPFGPACQNAMEIYENQYQEPLNLWWRDGLHSSMESAYLASCVLFSSIYQRSPQGIRFQGEIENDDRYTVPTYNLDWQMVTRLQKIGAETVFNDRELWNMDSDSL